MIDTNTDASGLHFLADNAKMAIFIYDLESKRFTYLNPAFRQTFELTKEMAIDPDSLLSVVHPEDRQYVLEAYQQLLKDKQSKQVEFRLQLSAQGERWVCLTLLMDKTTGRQRIVGYMDDVSSSRQYNDHLKKFGNKKNSVLHILAHARLDSGSFSSAGRRGRGIRQQGD